MTWKCKHCEYSAGHVMDLPTHLVKHGFPVVHPRDAITQFRHEPYENEEASK